MKTIFGLFNILAMHRQDITLLLSMIGTFYAVFNEGRNFVHNRVKLSISMVKNAINFEQDVENDNNLPRQVNQNNKYEYAKHDTVTDHAFFIVIIIHFYSPHPIRDNAVLPSQLVLHLLLFR
jgi:hypothetical protein